ncbi:hypothetical protein [Nostoc sp.]
MGSGEWGDEGDEGVREMREERITNAQCPINQIVMKVKCQVLGHWQ